MKFYSRNKELAKLKSASQSIKQNSRILTTVVGQKRIGKTTLIKESYLPNKSFIYFLLQKNLKH